MPMRVKKMLGSLFIFLFVVFWILLAMGLARHVPPQWYWQLAFYAVMGLGWGVPIFPVLSWMERTSERHKA